MHSNQTPPRRRDGDDRAEKQEHTDSDGPASHRIIVSPGAAGWCVFIIIIALPSTVPPARAEAASISRASSSTIISASPPAAGEPAAARSCRVLLLRSLVLMSAALVIIFIWNDAMSRSLIHDHVREVGPVVVAQRACVVV